MKYIITEEQEDLVKLEKNSDILFKLMNVFYPENYEYETSNDTTEVYKNEDNDELLFYYDWDDKEFVIGVRFIDELFKKTGVPFLDYTEVKTNKREMFDELIKVFAKRHYGWNVDKVHFHWRN